MNDNQFVKNLFAKYGIDNIVEMNDEYYDAYIDRIIYDYRVLDSFGYVANIYSKLSSFGIRSITIIIGAFISLLRSHFLKESKTCLDEDLIAVPFADHYIRYKHLDKMLEHPVGFYYMPFFHYVTYKKHRLFYKSKSCKYTLGIFRFQDIFKAICCIISNYHRFNKCSKELDGYFGYNTCHLPGAILVYMLYKGSINKMLRNLSDRKRIWLLDYDLDLKYILLNDAIKKNRPNDVTMHLQHGSFFKYDATYCNPVSDVSLCCSERERNNILANNKCGRIILPLGAPLQSFNDYGIEHREYYTKYDIVFLLTDVMSAERKDQMISVLSHFDFDNHNVKIRFRPVSKESDMQVLGKYIEKATISENTTLLQDVCEAKLVISFSEDATYVAIRENKSIILFVPEDARKSYLCDNNDSKLRIVSNLEEFTKIDVNSMLTSTQDITNDINAINNFGETDLDKISHKLQQIIDDYLER